MFHHYSPARDYMRDLFTNKFWNLQCLRIRRDWALYTQDNGTIKFLPAFDNTPIHTEKNADQGLLLRYAPLQTENDPIVTVLNELFIKKLLFHPFLEPSADLIGIHAPHMFRFIRSLNMVASMSDDDPDLSNCPLHPLSLALY